MKINHQILKMIIALFLIMTLKPVFAQDLADIKASGVLRHIGVPYANFVTGSGDGMDVELMKLFAAYIGVKYEYVPASWASVIGDLTGKKVKAAGSDIEVLGDVPVKGDVIANGFTHLAWREKIVDYSTPTFPSQIWLIALASASITPIIPSGVIETDIANVKALLNGRSVLGVANTCLEPSLYKLKETGADIRIFPGNLNEVAPAVMNKEAETSILDVPDALVALEKWPGQIKIIGPVSKFQTMGVAFRKDSPGLKAAFNTFLEECKKDGTYMRLVKKYYPAVFDYYSSFFTGES
jgi:ABC-type amino acid transport substrate-binding protein